MAKSTTKKKGLKQRMRDKKEELKKKAQSGFIIRQKEEGTIRIRILPTGDDNDFMKEVVQFWLGDEGSVVSPETYEEPCAVMEKYKELKASKKDADKDLAKVIMPKRRQLIPVLIFKDKKGKKIDKDQSGKLLQITNGLGQAIIDLYLDDDEWGDMTHPKDGYDLKITRDGLKMTDTTYTVQPCKNTPIDKAFKKDIDLDDLVRSQITSYEDGETKLAAFLNDEGGSKKKKSKKGKGKKGSKKSKKSKKKSKKGRGDI